MQSLAHKRKVTCFDGLDVWCAQEKGIKSVGTGVDPSSTYICKALTPVHNLSRVFKVRACPPKYTTSWILCMIVTL
jgi:hypothetical protein